MAPKRKNMEADMPCKRRRGVFQEMWTEKYFFIEYNDKSTV